MSDIREGAVLASAALRVREKLDFGWLFHKGDIHISRSVKVGMSGSYTDIWFVDSIMDRGGLEIFAPDYLKDSPSLDDWIEIDLPHDWCIDGPYVHDDSLGSVTLPGYSGYLRTGVGFYRKTFELCQSHRHRKVHIEFDGVMRNCTVWVNGHLMGTHFSGYTSFSYDITDIARFGNEGTNVILARVDAREYEGWWYEGAGIYRHVWLVITDRLYVKKWGTYITTPVVTKNLAEINLAATVMNEYSHTCHAEVVFMIFDADKTKVAEISSKEHIEACGEKVFEKSVGISKPHLWSPDSPYLYRALTIIKTGETEVDTYETAFGVRTIEFRVDEGFLLNGKPLLLRGTCNHQDFAAVGIALPDRVNEYKIELLKEMGCNAYRCAHHPPTPELLDACDRLGMLVMNENRRLDCSPDGIKELESMLYRDRNHPSVILWSMENEEILEGTIEGARILKTLVNITRSIDPTRPVTAGINHDWNENSYADILDVVGYNHAYRGRQYVKDHLDYPNRKIVLSEAVAYPSTRGVYADDKEKNYCPAYYAAYGPEVLMNFCSPHEQWKDVVGNPFLSGIFVWSGFDYRGEPFPHKWPNVNSHFGIMDTCGFPKDMYYYWKSVWTTEPMVHVFPHWNWIGHEGKDIEVWVLSNCETVELFLNGQSLGERECIPCTHLTWNVSYSPGDLMAIARNHGENAARKIVSTTGLPFQVQLEPDRERINADGCDVSIIRVAIADDKGRVVPTANNEIRFEVTGPGKILGVGNGDPSSHEPDRASKRRAFNGYCLVIVQARKEEGIVRLTALSSSLGEQTIKITVN